MYDFCFQPVRVWKWTYNLKQGRFKKENIKNVSSHIVCCCCSKATLTCLHLNEYIRIRKHLENYGDSLVIYCSSKFCILEPKKIEWVKNSILFIIKRVIIYSFVRLFDYVHKIVLLVKYLTQNTAPSHFVMHVKYVYFMF